ncbi:MAG: transposase [Chloroflexi bacterium]|nr:transposase [Chloroflexota bacterium]
MLIYLTSWTEEAPKWLNEPPLRRCWKGFRFEILDQLENQGMVEQSRRAESLYLTRAGEQEARKLLAQHGFAPDAAKSSR